MAREFTREQRLARLNELRENPGLNYDKIDEAFLARFTWCTHVDGRVYLTFRAKSVGFNGSRTVPVKMHQQIMLQMTGGQMWLPFLEVMHLDGNVMNVTRKNLRLGTHAENNRNRCWGKKNE